MITIKEGRKAPVNLVGYFPGGGKYGYCSIRFAQAVAEQAGVPIGKLFFGGFIGSSVGSITAAPAATGTMRMPHLADLFLNQLPLFLPNTLRNRWLHPMQAVTDAQKMATKSLFGRSNLNQTPLYDRTHLEKTIHHYFGEIKFKDLTNTLIITSHKIGPDIEEPFDFYATPKGIREDSVLATENTTLDIPLADAIIASSAIPTIFPCHDINGMLFIDLAQVDTGLSQMRSLSLAQENSLDMGLVQFDSFLNNRPITAEEYNSQGFAQQIANQRLINGPAIHAKRNDRHHFVNALGSDNYHLLQISNEELENVPFNLNMLDTSPEEIKKLREGMDEHIENDKSEQLKHATEFAVENLEAYNAHMMSQNIFGPMPKASTPFNEEALDTSPEGLKQLQNDIIDYIGKENIDEKTRITIEFLIATLDETSNKKSVVSKFVELFKNNKPKPDDQTPS